MKTVKEIWDVMRPVQNDEQMARLMFCKAQRLEERIEKMESAVKYIIGEDISDVLRASLIEMIEGN